jgi:hypothetical protein
MNVEQLAAAVIDACEEAESGCDAQCDAISADRIELPTRAVVLVAGMRIPEAAREAVLTRATAELGNAAEQRPPTYARAGGEHRRLTRSLTPPPG